MCRDFMSRLFENLFISLPIYSLNVQNFTNASKLKTYSKSGFGLGPKDQDLEPDLTETTLDYEFYYNLSVSRSN